MRPDNLRYDSRRMWRSSDKWNREELAASRWPSRGPPGVKQRWDPWCRSRHEADQGHSEELASAGQP